VPDVQEPAPRAIPHVVPARDAAGEGGESDVAMLVSSHGRRICELAHEAARAEDPAASLRAIAEMRGELEELTRVQVHRALSAGRSFGDVARALGISRQAAHRRFRQLAPARRRARRRLEATEEARLIARFAAAEAVATGEAAGSRHVLLGILRTDTDAARVLRAEGITLERARACAPSTELPEGDPDTGNPLRQILRTAGRIALAQGSRHLGPEQLLLAALANSQSGACRTVTALGATPASVHARLGARCVTAR
jgi:ATP-dependent Clp protease ATP-binding subunit ClpA